MQDLRYRAMIVEHMTRRLTSKTMWLIQFKESREVMEPSFIQIK